MSRTKTWGMAVLLLIVACGSDDSDEDPARQRLRTEVLTVHEALKTLPNSPILYYQLGQIYRKYGVDDSALVALEHCVELYPAFAQAHQQLAEAYFEAGDLQRSEAAWANTATYEPGHLETWNNLGFVRRKLGNLVGAKEAYLTALSIDSVFAETLNNLGQVYREQEHWKQAVEYFHRAMAADPTFRGAYINLARLYEQRQELDAERGLLTEIRERFGRTSREGRYASVRLEEMSVGGS